MITVDVVVPVRDEAHVLAASIARLCDFVALHPAYTWSITIAENGSTDDTRAEAQRLCQQRPGLRLVTDDRPGRGRALRSAWMSSAATIVAYVDVDHSTSLEDIPRLVHEVAAGGYDIAVASRRLPASRVTRSLKRRLISDAYNLLLQGILHVTFSDAQTGCKVLHRRVVDAVLPDVRDESWFLDTELLVLAQRRGYRIADVPVTWVEDDDSRVRIIPTALDDLRGIARLWWHR